MVKLAIFDFDGVVADTLHLAIKTANTMLEGSGYRERVSAQDLRGKGLKGIIKEIKLPVYKLPVYIKKSRSVFNKEVGSIRAFPGIRSALLRMKGKCKLAIVSSNSEENIAVVLKNNKMDGIFDFIIAGADVFGKSSKIRKAMKLADANREEAVCVGDEERDIEAARKAGLRIIAVSWGFNSEGLLAGKKPDYLVRKPGELAGLIKNIL